MNEETLQPIESLRIIDSMINKARNQFSENGHMYLLWGWVILFCSIGHFMLEHVFKVKQFYLVWMACWAALFYQFVYFRNRKRSNRVTTYADHIIQYVWLTFIIMMALLIIVVTHFSSHPHNTDAVFLVLYGMPTFLSGIIIKFPWLVRGGIFCWMLSLLSLVIPIEFHMLLISAAVIAAWIIPGYLLRRQYKSINARN
jgi:hypothetical protein